MKRLLLLLGLLLAFALPNHAQTKTDTIKFEAEAWSGTLDYRFSTTVRTGIEIEWVSADGTKSKKFSPDADGKYTQSISGNGTGYIYYTYEQGSTYSAYLRESDDYYSGNDDIIVVAGRCSITSLDVSGCTALTSLSCHNELTSLDVSGCTALTYLSCYNNRLKSLDLSKNTALTYLSCYGNQLTSLDVSKNTALTNLWCNDNQLTGLDVSNNTALTWLDCEYNQLTDLDVSKNTALTFLDCHSNQLTSLDVSKNTALRTLYCSYNQLTSLDLSHNTALRTLSCGNNRIPLSLLYNYSQQIQSFSTGNQSDSILLLVDQPFDLSTERIIGQTISSFELTDGYGQELAADFWTENRFVFQFHEPLAYTLVLQNPAVQASDDKPATFTWYISVVDQIPEGYFTIQVASNKSEWGTASPGNGIYKKGENVTIIATPKAGCRFVNWTNGNEVFSTDSVHTFMVSEDLELTAHFEKIQEDPEEAEGFRLSLFADNPEQGYVFRSGNNCTYEEGEEVMILALPKEGYRFVNWTKGGTEFSKEALHTLFVTEDMELTAYFEKLPDDVATESMESDHFKVYVLDHNIILSENRGLVQVFNAVGQCVYSGNATIIPVRQSGVYVVRVGVNSHKVIVK
ncbi:MAG: leucine-rich repeat domain-containing protein [Lentimicrobiaceae bacterium]|nr:leucine-rich repeat domain-containing protein [Lentimicrobiaceae bacterium]